jgi:beta-lactamase regulating signal transducer with metallopeptidase domain
MLWWFAETTLVAAALAALATGIGRWGRLGPAARHALWLVVLIKLVTPPLFRCPLPASLRPIAPEATAATAPAEAAFAGFEVTEVGVVLNDEPAVMEATPFTPWQDLETTPTEVAEVQSPFLEGASMPAPAPAPTLLEQARALWARMSGGAARWAVGAWLVGSAVIGAGQVRRIVRFRRRLAGAWPAPEWLTSQVERIARTFGVRPPEARVVPGIGTPLLWCLGRPVLLLPEALVKTLESERWPGVLAHELAHLRRGDPWVRRLELAAGLLWWWNPLYWLVRRRLDIESELACDAWVVWLLPKGRRAYAEALLDVCATVSLAQAPSPALGALGAGRLFERRLTMILRDRVPCRLSPRGLLAPGLLALLALPSWSPAQQAEETKKEEKDLIVKVVPLGESKEENVIVKVVPPGESKDAILHKGVVVLQDDLGVVSKPKVVIVGEDDDDDDDDDKGKDKDKDKAKKRETVVRRRVLRDGDAGQGEAKDDAEHAEALKKAQAELAEMKRAMDKAQQQVRSAHEQLAKQARQMAEAQRRVAELQGRGLRARTAVRLRVDGPDAKPGPEPKPGARVNPRFEFRTQPFPGGGFGMPGGPQSREMEKRLDALEKKVDKLLDELKEQRKGGSSRDRD